MALMYFHIFQCPHFPIAHLMRCFSGVTVCTSNITLINFCFQSRPRSIMSQHFTNLFRFVLPMIELKYKYIGFSTIGTRVLHQIFENYFTIVSLILLELSFLLRSSFRPIFLVITFTAKSPTQFTFPSPTGFAVLSFIEFVKRLRFIACTTYHEPI